MLPEIADVANVTIFVLLRVFGVRLEAVGQADELPDAEQDHGRHEDLMPRLQVDLLQGDHDGVSHESLWLKVIHVVLKISKW